MKHGMTLFLVAGLCTQTAFGFGILIPEVTNITVISADMRKGCDRINNLKDKASCAIAGLQYIESKPSVSNENYKTASARGIDTACWRVSSYDAAADCYFAAIYNHFDVWQKCSKNQSNESKAMCFHASFSN